MNEVSGMSTSIQCPCSWLCHCLRRVAPRGLHSESRSAKALLAEPHPSPGPTAPVASSPEAGACTPVLQPGSRLVLLSGSLYAGGQAGRHVTWCLPHTSLATSHASVWLRWVSTSLSLASNSLVYQDVFCWNDLFPCLSLPTILLSKTEFLLSKDCIPKKPCGFCFFFKIFFFWCGPFLKSLFNLLQYWLLFYVLVFSPWGMWDLTSDWTHTPCIGRQGFNHWTTREVPALCFLNSGHS